MTDWSEGIDPMMWIDKEGTSNYGSRQRRTKGFSLFLVPFFASDKKMNNSP
jgi:hypothetical protein